MWTVSPSTQCPDRSTSGSTAAPLPIRSMPVTGGSECRSTPAASFTPSARAYHVNQTPARSVAPLNSASFPAVHSRMWTVPPRGYAPGRTPRSSSRAPAAAVRMRPGGLMNSSQPTTTHHHDTVGIHG